MRFHLVDRILDVQPGKSLRAVKNLTLGEEYLADHFPTFPVMPGVLMLEALVEAGAWLLRATDDFSHSVIVLREAEGVKYGSFMEPGRQMTITIELIEQRQRNGDAQGQGRVRRTIDGGGQLIVARYNCATATRPCKRWTSEWCGICVSNTGCCEVDRSSWERQSPDWRAVQDANQEIGVPRGRASCG